MYVVIICLLWFQHVMSIQWATYMDSYVYLGDTPYQNETFRSSNVSAALRVQRDIAMNITIDRLLWPAINVSAASFTSTNISQALAMGYQRLVIDLYDRNNDWQPCPTCQLRDLLTSINDHITSTDLADTNLVFLIFNLNGNGTTYSLDTLLQDVFTSRLYTPANLTLGHINVSAHLDWPTPFHLINQGVRVLVGYGTFLNVSSDTIFSAQDIGGFMNTSQTRCPSNQSWPFISDKMIPFTYNTSLSTMECQYSPYFVHGNYSTSSSIYSSVDSGHLADNIVSTIWSWDVLEPRYDRGQCAAMYVKHGRWQVVDCTRSYRVACRSETDPLVWVLTKDTYRYEQAKTACPDRYVFEVPRVPSQNMILKKISSNVTETYVWIHLNLAAYDVDPCWVIGESPCWWSTATGKEFLGLITTSVVSGVIILILVGIFIWVKWAQLWRNRHSRSRKNMVQAMIKRREYVTVPA